MGYGLLISAFSKDEKDAVDIAIGSIFPSLLISGIIWPIEGMAGWVKVLSNFSPLTHTAEAMRCVFSRGNFGKIVKMNRQLDLSKLLSNWEIFIKKSFLA